MSHVFLTVIIPTFNSEKTLTTCLQSLALQTMDDFEVLVMDGLSNDGTNKIVAYYTKILPGIKWHSEKDKGIYDAMNKGLALAQGEWIYFLGSDDEIFAPDVFESVKRASDTFESDVIYGNVVSTRFNGAYDGEFDMYKLYQQNICHQAIFFRRSVFGVVGTFNIKYSGHADWEHNFRWFFSASIRKQYIDLVVANYADGGFSSSNEDLEFYKAKPIRYYSLGRKYLDRENKLNLVGSIATSNKNQGKFITYLYFKLKYLLLKFS